MACSRSGPASLQIIEKLVAAGAEVNCANKFSRTALHECVISNNLAGAQKMVESGANKEILDNEGRTARDLAFSRDCLEMVELLANQGVVGKVDENKQDKEEKKKDDTPTVGAAALRKKMTIEEEKDALKRRLAELEEGETKSLETRLKEKKLSLEKTKSEFRKQREGARAEIFKLEQKIKVLQTEEEKKSKELEKEIEKLASEIDKKKRGERPEKNKDIESCLECPICLDVCKPPLQVRNRIINLIFINFELFLLKGCLIKKFFLLYLSSMGSNHFSPPMKLIKI
jgi:hypothetical protein